MAHCTKFAHLRVTPTDLPANLPPPTAADQPVSQQTCLGYALAVSLLAALPVLNVESGKMLEHKQLQQHLRLKKTLDTSYANELGHLCRGVDEGTVGPKKQRAAGTSTFRVIDYTNIPKNKCSNICHTRVVCEYRTNKDDPDRTRIRLEEGHICMPYDVFTPTGSLELVKLMINSVLSRKNARFAALDVIFYT